MIVSFDLSQDASWESIALEIPKSPILEEKPRPKPMHTAIINDTEKDLIIKDLENKLANLNKAYEEQTAEMEGIVEANHKFISIIAHDLRSPFNSILGYLELLRNNIKTYDTDKVGNFIDYSYNAALKTYKLLDSLLEWAASKNGKIAFVPTKLNLYSVINEEIDFMDFVAKKKNIEVQHSVPYHINVYADQQMIKSVIRNLLNNAIKYTKEGGLIILSSSEKDGFIEISVKDNGIGMSPAVLASLFKINAIHSTIGTGNERGNGLGLLTCKDFIELHGGYISVESKLGEGSIFRFTLPNYIE